MSAAASGDYFDDEDKQEKLGIKDEDDGEEGDELDGRRWNVELKLKMTKVDSKNSFVMNLLSGDYARENISEILQLATRTARLKRILEAVLDEINSQEIHQ